MIITMFVIIYEKKEMHTIPNLYESWPLYLVLYDLLTLILIFNFIMISVYIKKKVTTY